MSNYIYYKVSDEITYPFPIFNGAAVDVWEYWDCDYLFMMGLKITPFSKSFVFHEEGQLPDPAPPQPTSQNPHPKATVATASVLNYGQKRKYICHIPLTSQYIRV